MITTVEEFLKKYNLLNGEQTFLVGFSGGHDSLTLLDILNKLSKAHGFKVIALHLNHNWRGQESLQDELNCKNFCKKNQIEYISETLDETTPKTEEAARKARYEFFLKHAKTYKNPSIFTAHTKTDNAETLIYRIIKGTGIKGLQGILPEVQRNGINIFRPLIEVSRDEIESYCISQALVANTDSSNFDTTYKRNFIRHKIMPLAKEINFQAEKALTNLSKIAISESNIVEEYLNLLKKGLFSDDKMLSKKFRHLSQDVKQKLIYDFVLENELEYDSEKISNILNFINENIDSKSGSKYSLTTDLWLFANCEYIYAITKKEEKNLDEIKIEKEGIYSFSEKLFTIKKYEGEEFIYPKEDSNIAYVNIENIDFTLRTRRDGDFITPFGMQGKMKLKKYLNSKGVMQHEKDDLVLLCKGSEVFWVIGVGLSNKLKVVNSPTHVLQFNR